MKGNIIISCEHGGNEIPPSVRNKISISKKVLSSHRGYDKGALAIAKNLSQRLNVSPNLNTISRLVLDYNRSLKNKNFWSHYSKHLPDKLKVQLILTYSHYRLKIQKDLNDSCLHLSVHSFTPVRNGIKRNCDFALLYDPSRAKERKFALRVRKKLLKCGIKCRLNYPYFGKSDGITSYFRKAKGTSYQGIELEFNQSIVDNAKKVNLILDIICIEIKNHIT